MGREHKCAAKICRELVPVKELMCLNHWHLLPVRMREMLSSGAGYEPHSHEWTALLRRASRMIEEKSRASA